MKNKFLKTLGIGACCLAGAIGLVGCQPETNINETTSDAEIRAVYELAVNNGETRTYEEWLASIKGDKGDKGDTPVFTVSDDGYWVIDGVKSNIKATGEKGDKGEDGVTPHIENGYWYVGEINTGVKATQSDVDELIEGANSYIEKSEENYTKDQEFKTSLLEEIKDEAGKNEDFRSYLQNYLDINTIHTSEEIKAKALELVVEGLEKVKDMKYYHGLSTHTIYGDEFGDNDIIYTDEFKQVLVGDIIKCCRVHDNETLYSETRKNTTLSDDYSDPYLIDYYHKTINNDNTVTYEKQLNIESSDIFRYTSMSDNTIQQFYYNMYEFFNRYTDSFLSIKVDGSKIIVTTVLTTYNTHNEDIEEYVFTKFVFEDGLLKEASVDCKTDSTKSVIYYDNLTDIEFDKTTYADTND